MGPLIFMFPCCDLHVSWVDYLFQLYLGNLLFEHPALESSVSSTTHGVENEIAARAATPNPRRRNTVNTLNTV